MKLNRGSQHTSMIHWSLYYLLPKGLGKSKERYCFDMLMSFSCIVTFDLRTTVDFLVLCCDYDQEGEAACLFSLFIAFALNCNVANYVS